MLALLCSCVLVNKCFFAGLTKTPFHPPTTDDHQTSRNNSSITANTFLDNDDLTSSIKTSIGIVTHGGTIDGSDFDYASSGITNDGCVADTV